jgi:VanZ family protein
MIEAVIKTSLQDRLRGEDRVRLPGGLDCLRGLDSSGAPERIDCIGRPPVLRRRTIRLLAVIGILGILYGSLAPFQIAPTRTWSWSLPMTAPVPGDVGCNIFIYIPVGILGRLLVRRRGSRVIGEWCFALLLAAGLSYAAEATQSVLVARVSSLTDWLCNVGGAMIGACLAPLAQRMLRNQHAWLYSELRVRPFTAAAAAATMLTFIAALMPFDFRPSPWRVAHACQQFFNYGVSEWASASGAAHQLDKLLAAAAYGALALLLVLAGREAGRGVGSAALWALKKSALLAGVIELLQLLTPSHVAQMSDLLLAWACTGGGAALATAWLLAREGRPPRAVSVARLLVAVGMFAVLARTLVGAAAAGGESSAFASWLPMSGQFTRPWGSLIGSYLNSLAHYTLVAGLMVLWYRASGVRPRPAVAMLGALLPVLMEACVSACFNAGFDTALVLLAFAAGIVAISVDRALFGEDASGAAFRGTLHDHAVMEVATTIPDR